MSLTAMVATFERGSRPAWLHSVAKLFSLDKVIHIQSIRVAFLYWPVWPGFPVTIVTRPLYFLIPLKGASLDPEAKRHTVPYIDI